LRLDKFLKSSRLIKRRTLAKEICDAGRISVNERVAKASTEVRLADVVTIQYGQKTVRVKVLQLLDNPRKDAASGLYEVLSEEPNAQIDEAFIDDANS